MTELISCHDCGKGISFSAVSCPHCGSTEPSGPYRPSTRETRRFRIEDRNDKRMLYAVAAGLILGLAYGLSVSSSKLTAVFNGPLYAMVCATVAVSITFVVNLFRSHS